jgi:predicted dehydrogenase
MRAVVVGAGRMGSAHARVARRFGLDVHTVDPHRPADFRSLREAPRAEIVAVATPIEHLADCALEALGAGCHRLLIEKPMATSVAQAEAVIEAARGTGATITVGYNDRYDALTELVHGTLLPALGPLHRLHFERRGPRPAAADPQGGPGIDLAVHDLDLLRHFGLVPVAFDGAATADGFEADLDCGAARATVRASYEPGARLRRFSIDGRDGSVVCDLVARRAELVTEEGITEHIAAGPEPLVGQWRAALAGAPPSGEDARAVLDVVLGVSRRDAEAAGPQGPPRGAGPARPSRSSAAARRA